MSIFKELKVVELASVLAGPLVGSFFSELGSEVIKIENPLTGGDVTRQWKNSNEISGGISAYYASANYNKKSVFINLKDEASYNEVLNLLKETDILICNFRKENAIKLKLDYNTLSALFPNLIYANITGFGIENSRPAYDVILQAESGFMYMNGEKGRPPVKMPVALIDILAAHHLKEAILCALLERVKSKCGKEIQISLFDCAIASLANQANNWLMSSFLPQAIGTQHPNIAPYGDMFICKDDKRLILAIGNDKQFELLCSVINLDSSEFNSNEKRINTRDVLNQKLSDIFELNDSDYWEELFLRNNIPFGIIKSLKEVFENEDARQLILKHSIDGQSVVSLKTAFI